MVVWCGELDGGGEEAGWEGGWWGEWEGWDGKGAVAFGGEGGEQGEEDHVVDHGALDVVLDQNLQIPTAQASWVQTEDAILD